MRRTTALATLLDALHAHDPHARRPPWSELRHVVRFASQPPEWVPERDRIRVLLAHRRTDGAFGGPVPCPDLGDVVRWVRRATLSIAAGGPVHVRPDATSGGDHDVAMHVVFPPHARLATLERLNAGWHARVDADLAEEAAFLARVADATGPRSPDGPFPHLMSGPVTVYGVEVAPLLDEAALLAEGSAMGHCVGTYAQTCRSGLCVILALSSVAGRSTAEVRLDPALLTPAVAQHRGPSNGPVPDGHAAALAEALLGVGPDALATVGRAAAAARRSVSRGAGRDLGPEDAERYRAMMMGQLRPHLWGTMRRMDHAEWLAHVRAVVVGAPVAP